MRGQGAVVALALALLAPGAAWAQGGAVGS